MVKTPLTCPKINCIQEKDSLNIIWARVTNISIGGITKLNKINISNFLSFSIHNPILQNDIIRDTKIKISKEKAKTFNCSNQI